MLSSPEMKAYVRHTKTVRGEKPFTVNQATQIGEWLCIEWNKISVEQFRMGLNIELEHMRREPATNIFRNEPLAMGTIAMAHLYETPDYYSQSAVMADRRNE